MPHPAAADILTVFAATGRPLAPDAAILIAQEIAGYGGLDDALSALLNDAGHALYGQLLAFQTALAEQAEPARRIARLRVEADDLDQQAQPCWDEGAQFAGKAAWRRLQGEAELAERFQRKAEAAEQLAADLEAQAFDKRLEAARLQAALACRQALSETLKEIAA